MMRCEKIPLRDKFSQNFKCTKLYVGKGICRTPEHQIQNLVSKIKT